MSSKSHPVFFFLPKRAKQGNFRTIAHIFNPLAEKPGPSHFNHQYTTLIDQNALNYLCVATQEHECEIASHGKASNVRYP